jgi:TonB family protein
MLIQRVQPIYPPIAKAARVSGTVVLQAHFQTGTVENLGEVSGPAVLQQAAIDAVKHWQYRPYLIDNEPVEVDTTVNVIFTLGGLLGDTRGPRGFCYCNQQSVTGEQRAAQELAFDSLRWWQHQFPREPTGCSAKARKDLGKLGTVGSHHS